MISDFLSAGGHLLLSGQDVGYYDDWWYYEPYYHTQLMAQLVADDASSRQLDGHAVFCRSDACTSAARAGRTIRLYPDVIRSLAPSSTEPAFDYAPDENGGQTVGLCRPYRAVYLPFGFEAINDRPTRAEVLSRTFSIFDRAPVRNAVCV